MSKMIPYSVADVLRHFVDVSIDLYGIECSLFIPQNMNDLEQMGIYTRVSDKVYKEYLAKVFIEWSPNVHRLRKLGIFAENEIPMIARFSRMAYDKVTLDKVLVEVIPESYIKVPLQYIPANIDTDEFELVDVIIEGMHDAEIVKYWKLVPRRVK